MQNVVTKIQLDQLMNDTMIYAVIVFLAALAVSFVICTLIPWQGGHDRSYIRRRWVFVIVGILFVLGFWLYNDQVVATTIKSAGFQNMFKACNMKCLIITSIGYLLFGGILMCVCRNSKFASIIFKIKGK